MQDGWFMIFCIVPSLDSSLLYTVTLFLFKLSFLKLTFVSLRYMKGRVSYDQLNAAVQSINTAVKAKYKILHQSVKTLNNHSRKLHQRFKDQETKDTKGTDNLAATVTNAHQS